MSKKYYKVVEVINVRYQPIRYVSCRAGGCFQTQYWLHEWVKPPIKGTRLMVFDSFKMANRFATNLNEGYQFSTQPIQRFVVFECDVKRPIKKYLLFVPWEQAKMGITCFLEKLLLFRKNKKKMPEEFKGTHIPKGTVFVTEVRLTRKYDNV